MQHILISMDEIDSQSDIESFVQLNSALMHKDEVPPFEQHPASIEAKPVRTKCYSLGSL